MAPEKLDFAATHYKQTAGTDGIADWMEIPGSPAIEIFRISTNESGDWILCNKISRVKAVAIQNHGATFATGVADSPKIAITQAAAGGAAKITITHTGTREVMSVMVIGEI